MNTLDTNIIEVEPIRGDSATEFNKFALSVSDQVTKIAIKNQEDYETASNLLKDIKDMAKKAEDARKKITSPLDQAKSAVMDLFRPTATALENCEKHLKSLMITYANEQERLRREQEEKLRKAAEAEEARKRKALEERAIKAAEKGNEEKAEELRQQSAEVFIPAPTVSSTFQKVSGQAIKQNWKARVIDINKVPREYMIVNESMLDKMAKATKGSIAIPGVEFYFENILSSR